MKDLYYIYLETYDNKLVEYVGIGTFEALKKYLKQYMGSSPFRNENEFEEEMKLIQKDGGDLLTGCGKFPDGKDIQIRIERVKD